MKKRPESIPEILAAIKHTEQLSRLRIALYMWAGLFKNI